MIYRVLLLAALLMLVACSSAPRRSGDASGAGAGDRRADGRPSYCPEGSPYPAATEDLSTRGNYTAGGLYKPGVKDATPSYIPKVECIPEPVVRDEPRSVIGNRSPYEVLGKTYKVLDRTAGFVEKGTASYYGAKFHGRLTSNREVYDMYTFSAAHKTLPLPSFARVTNLENGESVVVRINDRGPFHDGRVVDLSYAAAVRLGITQKGTGQVEVRALTPGKPERVRERQDTVTTAVKPDHGAGVQTAGIGTAPESVVSEALPPMAQSRPATAFSSGMQIQVASFAARENAERGRDRLVGGGIAGVHLQDLLSDGRRLWRLRVAVPAGIDATALMTQIAAMGLGQPRLVAE